VEITRISITALVCFSPRKLVTTLTLKLDIYDYVLQVSVIQLQS
jgi:hypothetical protein